MRIYKHLVRNEDFTNLALNSFNICTFCNSKLNLFLKTEHEDLNIFRIAMWKHNVIHNTITDGGYLFIH